MLKVGLLSHFCGDQSSFYYHLLCLCHKIRANIICLDNLSLKSSNFTTEYLVDFRRL
jgi:hypothetical protein